MAKKVLDLNSVDVVWRNASEKFLRKDEIVTSAEAYAAEEPAADVAYEKGELMFTFALPRGLQGIPGDPGKDGIGKDGDGVEYVYLLTNDNEVPGLYVPENFYEDNDYRQDEYLPYMSKEALEQGDITKRWTDNYVAPSATMRYSWVAIRKSKDGIWQPFSDPKLWNIYKTAGKSFVDIYKRSDTLLDGSNLPQHSNPIYYKFSNDTFYSDLEATSELKSIGTGYNTWYHDIPSAQGRYLYRASAYVDIIDLDHPVEINENAWMGPYFMSSNGEAIKTGYVTFDDDSFSLPIKENGHPWMDYNYSFNAYLWYGQDKLNINEIEVKDNSNGIEFNSNVIGDVATVSFAISKDYIFNDLSYINVTLSGEYEGEPITGSLQFKIIPFISEDGKFYKLLLSKDTILTPNEQTSEEDMNKWNDSVSIQVVDAKGNVINPDSINCKLYYTDDDGRDQEIVNGLLNFKSGESSQYNSYIDILDVPNPMVIKLVDDLNQTREVEYVNFIGTPLNGADGADGISARTVFAFTSTTDGSRPATPQGGSVDFDTNIITYPENWGDSNNLSGIVWMSQRDFYADGTKDTVWTTPIRITGEQGEPGTDGSSIEFIYRLCQSDLDIDDIITDFDQYKNKDKSEIIGKDNNWTDSPLGISIDNRIELCSTRSKSESTKNTDGKWSEWCTPFIWSKWGEDGIDGDGVEYIFFVSDKMNDELGYNKPPHPGTTLAMKREELSDDQRAIFDKYVNSFDFFPGQAWIDKQIPSASETEKVVLDMLDLGWTDDPQDVGPYEPVEFVSIRKKKVNPETNSITYEYTEPRVWSEWKRPGYDTYTEFIFAVHENLSGAIIEGGNYGNLDISKLETTINGEKVEVAWFDTLPQNNDPSKFIWMAKGFVSSELIYSYDADGKIDQSKTPYYQEIDWSSPIKMIDSQYMQVDYTSALNPGTPTSLEDIKGLYKDRDEFDITTLEGLELAFRDHEMEVNGVEWSDSPEDPIWMIVSTCNNGVWSDWSLSRIKGEKGDKGDAGTSVTIKGRFTTEENLKTAYEYYINPSGTKPNEYFNGDFLLTGDGYIVESTGDLWVYTEPFNPEDANFNTDWMNVGQVKGDSFYIYTIYASDRTDNGYILTGNVAPYGQTPGKWFGMHITEQKMDDSVVNGWYGQQLLVSGGPFNWSKWVGEDGFGQEQIFILGNDPGSAPDIPQWSDESGVSKETWNTQDYVPTGWSDTPLTPTISNKCCWMAVRKYPYEGEGANQFHGAADTNGTITINDKNYSNKAILFSQIGESPYHIELSNEYDQIYVGEDLKTTSDQTFTTTYKIFKGIEEYDGDVEITINGESGLFKSSTDKLEKTISITVENGVNLSSFDKLVFDIQFNILDEYNLSKNFRLVRLNSVMDYDLKVTPTYIKIDKDGNYSTNEVTCKINAKSVGLNSSIEELNIVPEGYILKTYNNGELNQTINNQGSLPTINSNNIVNNYKFELVKDEIIVDEVIVEILSDGQDGQPGESGAPGGMGPHGKIARNLGKWTDLLNKYHNDSNSDIFIMSGDGDNERYVDYVLGDNESEPVAYQCLISHNISTRENNPENLVYEGDYGNQISTDGYWLKAESFQFISTKLLNAEQIITDTIQSNQNIVADVVGASTGSLTNEEDENEKIYTKVVTKNGMVEFYKSNTELGVNDFGWLKCVDIGYDFKSATGVLRFYDANGKNVLYNLGPGGLVSSDLQSPDYIQYIYYQHPIERPYNLGYLYGTIKSDYQEDISTSLNTGISLSQIRENIHYLPTNKDVNFILSPLSSLRTHSTAIDQRFQYKSLVTLGTYIAQMIQKFDVRYKNYQPNITDGKEYTYTGDVKFNEDMIGYYVKSTLTEGSPKLLFDKIEFPWSTDSSLQENESYGELIPSQRKYIFYIPTYTAINEFRTIWNNTQERIDPESFGIGEIQTNINDYDQYPYRLFRNGVEITAELYSESPSYNLIYTLTSNSGGGAADALKNSGLLNIIGNSNSNGNYDCLTNIKNSIQYVSRIISNYIDDEIIGTDDGVNNGIQYASFYALNFETYSRNEIYLGHQILNFINEGIFSDSSEDEEITNRLLGYLFPEDHIFDLNTSTQNLTTITSTLATKPDRQVLYGGFGRRVYSTEYPYLSGDYLWETKVPGDETKMGVLMLDALSSKVGGYFNNETFNQNTPSSSSQNTYAIYGSRTFKNGDAVLQITIEPIEMYSLYTSGNLTKKIITGLQGTTGSDNLFNAQYINYYHPLTIQ